MATDEELRSTPSLAADLRFLLLLPALYLASVGPLYGLNDRGLLSDSKWDAICRTVYFPLVYLECGDRVSSSPRSGKDMCGTCRTL